MYYKATGTYLVLVMAMEFAETFDSASYSILFTSGSGSTSLQENVAFNDEVEQGNYKYYIFPLHYSHEDITITVTSLSGDPDIYISANNKPDKDTFDYSSSSYGSETLTIIWEDKLKAACPDLPETYSFGDPMHCNLHIAVFGFEQSSYSIRIVASKDLPSALNIDTP
jgi:hypothetical protein